MELLRLFSKVPARCIEEKPQTVDSQEQLNPIITQKEQLIVILEDKKRILNEIKNKKPSQYISEMIKKYGDETKVKEILKKQFKIENKDYSPFLNRLHQGNNRIEHYYFKHEVLNKYSDL